jgi:predicted Rossmann-fold nucleotide-binding protein
LINLEIVSGGQTGVDRAALDFALQNGIKCSGFCPKGRKAEDGRISSRYPLTETSSSFYQERTRLNVIQSDALLIVFNNEMGRGTEVAIKEAKRYRKPYFIVNLKEKSGNTVDDARRWINENSINKLNVAGPRASSDAGIYEKCLQFLEEVFGLGIV